MPKKPLRKILVAVDGSKRSKLTIKYICEHLGFLDASFVLFHVFSAIPESYWDLGKEPKSVRVTSSVRAWQADQKRQIDAFMQQCVETLQLGGFPKAHVKIKIKKRSKGVARDIIGEARNGGYDAVIIRRRGMHILPEIIMGSVASKLIQKLSFVPVIVAGLKDCTGRVLIAFDGSTDAMRAVRFVGDILKDTPGRVTLFYAIRAAGAGGHDFLFSSPEYMDAARAAIDIHFDAAVARLRSCGMAPEAITTRIAENVDSRALAIRREAEEGEYGTIVVGRRGMSRVRDFFMGRVSNKILNGAREHAVWVIT